MSNQKPLGNDIAVLIRNSKGNPVVLQPAGSYSPFNISGIQTDITIDGQGATVNGQMKFDNCGKVTLKNIRIVNGNQYGVMVVDCKAFTADRLGIADPQRSGILTANTPNVDIGNCNISGAKEQHGIYCSQSGDVLYIHDNHITDCAFSGVQVNAVGFNSDLPKGANNDSISENVTIEHNIIENCQKVGHAGAIQLSGVHTGNVAGNNILNHLGKFIISLWDDGTNNPKLACKDVTIQNNSATFADAASPQGYVNVGKNCTYTKQSNHFDTTRVKELISA